MEIEDKASSFIDQYKAFKFDIYCHKLGRHQVTRRFSDFVKLHKYLTGHYSYSFLPHIPEKNVLAKVTNIGGNSFLEERMASLEIYIWKLLNHSTVVKDPKFIEFITLDKFDCDLGSSKLLTLTSEI